MVPQRSFDTVTSTATGGTVGNDNRLKSTWSNSTSVESNIVTANENIKNDDVFGTGMRRGVSSDHSKSYRLSRVSIVSRIDYLE